MPSSFLTFIIFTPLVGALAILFVKEENGTLIKTIGFAFSVVAFALSIFLYIGFDPSYSDMQFVEKIAWIRGLNISYHVGIDGLSLLLILLTTFLTPLALLSSWNSIKHRLKGYVAMLLVLEVGMLGVFCAIDLFLFYFFWEAMLIPMCFIIGVWGGENRIYAAVKFFLYTMVGSLLMLVAILWLAIYASRQPEGTFTTDLLQLYSIAPTIPLAIQTWMFLAFALSCRREQLAGGQISRPDVQVIDRRNHLSRRPAP